MTHYVGYRERRTVVLAQGMVHYMGYHERGMVVYAWGLACELTRFANGVLERLQVLCESCGWREC